MFLRIMIFMSLILSTYSIADDVVSRKGNIVIIVANGDYLMGDSDNKINARNLAITQAKINASEIAGTYIESSFDMSTTNNNGEVSKISTKELHSFTSSVIKSEIVSDKVELSSNQKMIYKITIKATVDVSILQQRIKELSNDKARKDELAKLQKENQKLVLSLNALNTQLISLESSKQIKSADIKVLQDQRENILKNIAINIDNSTKLFNGASMVNEFEQKKQSSAKLVDNIDFLLGNPDRYFKVVVDKPSLIGESEKKYHFLLRGDLFFDEDKFKNELTKTFLDFNIEAQESSSLASINLHSVRFVMNDNVTKEQFQRAFIKDSRYWELKCNIGNSEFFLERWEPRLKKSQYSYYSGGELSVYVNEETYVSLFSLKLKHVINFKLEVPKEDIGDKMNLTCNVKFKKDHKDPSKLNSDTFFLNR